METMDENYCLHNSTAKSPAMEPESIVNKLISTVYSGPTISDIESALSFTFPNALLSDIHHSSQPIFPFAEKVMDKMENKYTLRIKACGNVLADDGYKWRKYGQKSIKNSPNPRSYYRCTNPRCNAKKQVERSTEDPETLVITYEGLHLHYTYSHFLLSRSQDYPLPLHATKKPKNHTRTNQDEVQDNQTREHTKKKSAKQLRPVSYQTEISQNDLQNDEQNMVVAEDTSQNDVFDDYALESSQGLLEDVVPLLVRKPCNSAMSSDDNEASALLYSSHSNAWISNSPYHDFGLLSSIM